jgi:hypothetical protein
MPNHNEVHYGGRKSPMYLKLEISTTRVIDAKLVIVIHYSIFKNFSKKINGLKSILWKLYFVS